MADLVSGRYGQANPLWSIFGQTANVVNPEVPGRSNVEVLGGLNTAVGAAVAGSGVGLAVMVPVDPGTVISKVTMYVTATAASTPTHSFAALYSGIAVPALIGQSTDGTTTAIAANAPFSFTLASSQLITPAQAPNGFVYVSISVTGTAVPSALTVSGPTLAGWGTMVPPTGAPILFAATHGSGLNGTAAATIASQTNIVGAPVVVLT